MILANELKKVIRIEIEPPEQLMDSRAHYRRVVIDSEPIIKEILSTLVLEISDTRTVQGCKVPLGFRMRLVKDGGSYEADITLSGHKHIVVRDRDGSAVHYELPPRFEEIIQPYLMESLRL